MINRNTRTDKERRFKFGEAPCNKSGVDKKGNTVDLQWKLEKQAEKHKHADDETLNGKMQASESELRLDKKGRPRHPWMDCLDHDEWTLGYECKTYHLEGLPLDLKEQIVKFYRTQIHVKIDTI